MVCRQVNAMCLQVIYGRVVGQEPSYEHVLPIITAMLEYSKGLQTLVLPDFLNPQLRKYEEAKRTLQELLMVEVDIVRAQYASSYSEVCTGLLLRKTHTCQVQQ